MKGKQKSDRDKSVLVQFSKSDLDLIDKASKSDKRLRKNFIEMSAIENAKKVIKESKE